MARITKAAQAAQAEAIEKLRADMTPGTTVRCVLRHVSRSGMQRHIDVYVIQGDQVLWMSGLAAKALGWSQAKSGAIKVDGCGMDMGFALVNALSYALHGTEDVGDEHSLGLLRHARVGNPDSYRAGYSLRHEWL